MGAHAHVHGSRRMLIAAAGLALVVSAGVVAGVVAVRARSPRTVSSPSPFLDAYQFHRSLPDMPLISADGRPTSLAAYRGKVVLLAPFLTLCSEVCPLTTGAFAQMQRDVRRAGLSSRVVFVEVSVDPWRDSPARLRAFARFAGVSFPMLTGTRLELAHLWRFFGVGYRRIPQGHPPAQDWWTHKPLTFDIEHTDVVLFIDPDGVERLVMMGMPGLDGHLSVQLKGLLSATGRQNLVHPMGEWRPSQALHNLSVLLAKPNSLPQ